MKNLATSSITYSTENLDAVLQTLQTEQKRRLTENKLAYYRPYLKQADFHAAGATHRERLLAAGNQLGKTLAGGFEAAMHATGQYPPLVARTAFLQPRCRLGVRCDRRGSARYHATRSRRPTRPGGDGFDSEGRFGRARPRSRHSRSARQHQGQARLRRLLGDRD